jgi:hypothetical protein
MKRGMYSHWKFGLTLIIGALLALVLCVQCVRTYLYTDAVLVPQQAQREAERQAMALGSAARTAGITDPRALGSVVEHAVESASDRVLWMRVLDSDLNVVAEAGSVSTTAAAPPDWRERPGPHENPGVIMDTPHGKAFIATFPLRMPRPPRPPSAEAEQQARSIDAGGINRQHFPGYAVELAISLKAVAGAFDGLRQNLIVGLIASIVLLAAVAVIGLRTPQYLRGKYLEGEMQLAKRVQRDLQPKPQSTSPGLVFAAASIAADHVGGDFYDIFEAATGETTIVLGDVSGKGVSAALLVSVLQGAIRSSTSFQHEIACERINRMLCERTARARFATLFWGVFDPASGILRYVNAGHTPPILLRSGQNRIERLDEGGPVLGLLPMARYFAGAVKIERSDTLVLFSDGVNEAANQSEEEFGEDRLQEMVLESPEAMPKELCDRLMTRVSAFASGGPAPDDRTLVVVQFQKSGTAISRRKPEDLRVEAVA